MESLNRWLPLSKGLHWLVALLLVAVWGAVELHEVYAKGDPMREWWKMVHFSLGLTMLLLVIFRLYWRARQGRPEVIGTRWQRWLSATVHGALYGLLLAMPVSGFVMRQFSGKAIEIYGLVTVPQLTAVNIDVAKQIAFFHKELLWNALLALVVAHVVGALWHHFVDRDATLRRMLPGG